MFHRAGDLVANPNSAPPLLRPREVVAFEPVIRACTDDAGNERMATCLPFDREYSVEGETPAPSTRVHRTYVALKGNGQSLAVEGVRRSGLLEELGVGWHDFAAGDVGLGKARL